MSRESAAGIRAEGWPLLAIEGVEADDVIGTLSHRAAEAGWQVVISTGDKDLTQLVRPGVRWVNTMSEEVLDEALTIDDELLGLLVQDQ